MHNLLKIAVLLAAFLLAGGLSACTQQSDPEPIEGAIDISNTGVPGMEVPEGSASRVPAAQEARESAPALTDAQLAEGSKSDYDGHPPVDPNPKAVQREIVVPKSVEGKWKAVKILVRDKTDEEKNVVRTVNLGDSFRLGDSGITVSVGPFLPNFMMDEGRYTSTGNELGNPAVYLVVRDGDTELYRGWAFAKFPSMYAFEHARFSLQLMDFIPAPVG